ncbi:LysR family transcriptional regulator [Niveibacterium umoris]|uniref:DNA-binding transcriptional LysR family regulator n=1 Tax=Niveibacterium umoris TaxID=1193620 RepID=A0A840BIS8_9RHOO|nr:LysR family transcriptional regulator [Niveibacterium umoris]MBB4013451.1 DNA-binding transcriptional LysR family regulator [Niveibacterium umoris]
MSIPFERIPGLLLFARVARSGSFSSAATALGLSRSAVSKQVAAVEAQIGGRLIQRTTRSLELTELGEAVLAEAERIEAALEAIDDLGAAHAQEVRGKLRVSSSTAAGRELLVPLLPEFHRRYPALELELGLEDRFVDLVAERVDVAIRIGHLPDSSLVARRLGELTWALVASPDYLARRGTPARPEDLAAHDCLCYGNAKFRQDTWGFVADGEPRRFPVRGALVINDASALVDAAIRGMGVLLIDRALVQQPIEAGLLRPLLPDYPPTQGVPVYVVYPDRSHLPARTQAFVDFLLERFAPLLAATGDAALAQ